MINIRPISIDDHQAIMVLVTELPEWFEERTRNHSISIDLKHQDGFVAEIDGTIVGFVTLFVSEGRLNIGWLGVKRTRHRKGIGSRLLTKVELKAKDMGLKEIGTYTLGDGVENIPYEATRAFYWKQGFKIYQRNKTDYPGCPEEIKISKKISE